MKIGMVSDTNCKHYNSILPSNVLQGMSNIFGLAVSVVDTILRFTISNEQDN